MRRSTADLCCLVSVTRAAAPARRVGCAEPGAGVRQATCGYHIRMVGTARPLAHLALVAVLLSAACSDDRPPVTIKDNIVIVENQTPREWRNVVISVNDHFRGGGATLAAGGRMTAPLSGFQTAFGQRFDRSRQSVSKIEVTATDAGGTPVALTWSGNTGRQ